MQDAFMSGRECMDQIFYLHMVTEQFLAKKPEAFCAFVDLQKAFDRADRNKLCRVFSKYGVNTNLIQAIAFLYKGSIASVRVNGGCTG